MALRKPVFDEIVPNDRGVTNRFGLVTEVAPPTPYGMSYGTDTGGWGKVAEMVLTEVDTPILWVPDTCVKINPVANCFWEAAREAHSISFRPQVLLTEPIKAELPEWINAPRDRPNILFDKIPLNFPVSRLGMTFAINSGDGSDSTRQHSSPEMTIGSTTSQMKISHSKCDR
ncbi:hypothetical protein [Allorhodopirellula heiligendammensis]|uniref:Uncharacterized protein n=1 Tax=Allorhodopirellula heiligendammensis TaxID=2714739 RepID=A0A5C6C178_9BACT|nr:hypothetical protein [Allorhodopirellula heiligendammensis]TWU17882.1 hypothetical protein Poly21_00330 [Allorhodopirellula heiligendammensis]